MEGDTETAEEKEGDDTELSGEEGVGQLHQSGGSSDEDQDLPIMQWEDLSLRIAELEKQEEERRERAKSTSGSEQGSVSGGWAEERQGGLRRREEWEEEDYGRCRVTVFSSRFHNHRNLQLCYTNNSSESEDDDTEEGAGKEGSKEAGSHGYHPSGLKLEVRAALSELKNKLLAEQKEKEHLACVITKRKHLECCDLQICSIQQLSSLRTSLNHDIHDLSSELVGHLLIRDQLRTKQDAMLLDVQDLT
ncbi:schwannomin-interacting protein 1-like [Oncorhynchus masou masou]|uniref:schwannomin-interacting protein 1-like n=1 Tax=Oncorhynchus masou masou TaxID=90313 RepID=UPI0031836054